LHCALVFKRKSGRIEVGEMDAIAAGRGPEGRGQARRLRRGRLKPRGGGAVEAGNRGYSSIPKQTPGRDGRQPIYDFEDLFCNCLEPNTGQFRLSRGMSHSGLRTPDC
jgi:hypothetical protein